MVFGTGTICDSSRFVLRLFGGIQGIQNEKGFRSRGYMCVRSGIGLFGSQVAEKSIVQ
jgi:hypothetical protein